MDLTEDLSARVLLKNILSTEPPRSPITRSATRAGRTTRRSKKDAGAQTPQNILRRSLKNKMQESITRKSLPARRRPNPPAPASLLFDDGDTPRHILKNILLTEPVKSPVVHETAASEEPQMHSSSSSITRKRPSTELSGLDLPDLTIGIVPSTAKGLERKRPRRSLNVTAFEKRLKDGDDVETESEDTRVEHSSLSLSSSTSLNLKTPFVEVQTEKRGLQRRVSNRRKITEEEFGAAVNNRRIGAENSLTVECGLSETAFTEGFTLGLSKLSEPDITTDIVNCNTALYAQSDGIASNFSMVATQDKPTVMASQLQRQLKEMEEEKSDVWKEQSAYAFPNEEVNVAKNENEEWFFRLEEDEDVIESEGQNKANTVDEPKNTTATSESEERVAEICGGQDASESKEIEDGQSEDLAATKTKYGEDATNSQNEEENEIGSLQHEEAVVTESQYDSEEKEVASDREAAISQTRDAHTFDSQEIFEALSQSEEDGDEVECQTEDGQIGDQKGEDNQGSEQLNYSLNHINRQAYRSEGELIAVADAGGDLSGLSDGKSQVHSAGELHSSLKMGDHDSSQPPTEIQDLRESSNQERKEASFTTSETDADKENFNQQEGMHDDKDSGHLSNASSVEDEQEEVWQDEGAGEDFSEFPCKTPAFVREKRNFFKTDPVATSSLKNIQASSLREVSPAAKPKQARQRKRGPTKKEPGLSKSYLMGVFKHFAKTKVSADVYPVLKEIMDKFFDRLAEDLETYAHHAKRNTIEFEDAVLLLKRQGYVNDKVPVEALIEKYLRLDQRRLLIPIATSGNVVIPNKR